MDSLDEMKNKIEQIAKIIDAPISQMITFGNSRDDGTHNIEINETYYFYVTRDRGVSQNRPTQNLEELLYWVFDDVCFSMAVSFEHENRLPQVDPRRIMFQYQLGLLKKINTEWYWKKKMEIGKILSAYPYNDGQ